MSPAGDCNGGEPPEKGSWGCPSTPLPSQGAPARGSCPQASAGICHSEPGQRLLCRSQAADNPAGRQPWELSPREERALPPAGHTPAAQRPAAGRCGSHGTLGLLLIQAWRPCWGSRAGQRAGCPWDPSSPGPWMPTEPISCPRLWDASSQAHRKQSLWVGAGRGHVLQTRDRGQEPTLS